MIQTLSKARTLFITTMLVVVGSVVFFGSPVLSQETSTDTTTDEQTTQEVNTAANSTSTPDVPLQAKIGKDRNVLVDRTVLFDASSTTGPKNADLQYFWDFGDGSTAEGIDATHVYTNRGTYRVRLTVTNTSPKIPETSEAEIFVSVQDRLLVLIADQSVSEERIAELESYALTQGTLIVTIIDTGVDQEYLTVQNLAQQMVDHQDDLTAADIIMTWTSGNVGLNSLIELSRISALTDTPIDEVSFESKAIVAINDQSLVSSVKIAQTAFQSLLPHYIVVSDSNIVDDVIRSRDSEQLEENLASVDADYQIVTAYTARGLEELGPFNFMSYAVSFMINRGVPINSLFLILMLPVMATIIAVARQIGGIKAFGIFVPTVVSLSFLATGLKYGITVFVAIIIIGTIARLLARKLRLLYLPRMAIVLSILSLSVFLMFLIGAYTQKTGFIAISIFPILIMTVLTENFIAVQIEQGYKVAIKLTLETLVLSIVGYYIGDWAVFKAVLLAYPELILLTFVINYMAGKFSGLRLTEYLRFRSVLKHLNNAGESK